MSRRQKYHLRYYKYTCKKTVPSVFKIPEKMRITKVWCYTVGFSCLSFIVFLGVILFEALSRMQARSSWTSFTVENRCFTILFGAADHAYFGVAWGSFCYKVGYLLKSYTIISRARPTSSFSIDIPGISDQLQNNLLSVLKLSEIWLVSFQPV